MSVLFELNDWRLAWHGAHGTAPTEPGAALIQADQLAFGDAALAQSRLHPRGFYNQHWQLLNAEAIAVTAPGARNQADLIYRHLLEMLSALPGGKAEAVCAAVPGLLTPDQLGMLLGIMQEAGVPLRGFVDTAVLHCIDLPLPERSYCIDVHGRRGVLTELLLNDNHLTRGACNALPQMGLLGIIDGWLDLLVDQFVARTRFDPLRVAATEQQVFDQVLDWLDQGGTLTVNAAHEGSARSVDLSFEEMCARAQQRYVSIKQQVPSRSTIVLAPNAARLPGLEYYLSGHGFTVLCPQADTLWANAQQSEQLFADSAEGVRLTTALPARRAAAVETPPQAVATHLLVEHDALPMASIGQGLTQLPGTGWGWQQPIASVTVNDREALIGEPLLAGDSVRIGDTTYLGIRVQDGQAPV